ncbi:MAG TPA: glycosyltransferase family 2 protein [Ignavibacteriaceae bacterium]|nr:glycosyltransferase family 2 protein [Ignavibacteriaceae bacterium]
MGTGIIKDISISIIIINYNGSQLLAQCLQSIAAYTEGLEYEIIVVDNASNEGNLEQVLLEYPDVRLIQNKENLGFAKANNIGLEYAAGKFILFLNNDTYFIENSLRELFDFAESISNDVFIGCKLMNKDGSDQISVADFDTLANSFGESCFLYKLLPRSRLFNRFHYNYETISRPIEVDLIKGAFMFCSGAAVKKLGGFDSRFFFFGEESDLCYRFKAMGGKVFYYPGTRVYHVGGATVDKNQWFKFKQQNIAKIKKYQKHYRGIEFSFLLFFHYMGLFLRIPVYFFSARFSQAFFYMKLLFEYPENEFDQ